MVRVLTKVQSAVVKQVEHTCVSYIKSTFKDMGGEPEEV